MVRAIVRSIFRASGAWSRIRSAVATVKAAKFLMGVAVALCGVATVIADVAELIDRKSARPDEKTDFETGKELGEKLAANPYGLN